VFFYSAEIFKSANIPVDKLQYAILSTGVVIFVTAIMCMVLIDRLGRRVLIVVPIMIMIVDFIVLTIFLSLKVSFMSFKSELALLIFWILVFGFCCSSFKTFWN
jgi:hypothetical protein